MDDLENYSKTVAMLHELENKMGDISDDISRIYETAVEIRKRAIETEVLVNECIRLIEE